MGGAVHKVMCAVVRAGLPWLAATAAFAGQVVDPAAVRQAVTAPDVTAIEAAINRLAAEDRASELAFRLQEVADDPGLQPVSRAWLLDRGLHALAPLTPTAEARAVVLELSRREPEVYTKADPDHGDRATPLYDTGATARYVLQGWQREAGRRQARDHLASGRIDAVDLFVAADEATRTGILAAYGDAPLPQLVAQRDAVAAAMTRGARVDGLALVIARRLADSELAALVIGRAAPPVALAAVRLLPQVFEPGSALELLLEAGGRSDIASAAMLEIGALARHDAAARAALLESLDDPGLGPSAAAALARIGDPAVPVALGRRLQSSRSDWAQRMSVLALKLDSSPAAREALQRFAQSGDGRKPLTREVRQWLER